MNCGNDMGQERSNEKAARGYARPTGFTLIELLTVISILGIIAALTVPAFKEFGKSDASITAGQQLLRDVARARQLAIADRTTVYMIFVPAGFFTNTAWYNQLTPAQQTLASNLCESQLTGYTFAAYGALGDQPGNHHWHYLAPWQNLPQGTFIAPWKFDGTFGFLNSPFAFSDPANSQSSFRIHSFNYQPGIPFPTDTSSNNPATGIWLPNLQFNYLGQLISTFDQDYAGSGEDIPLVKGAVMTALDPTTKMPQFGAPQLIETPPGNGTNIAFNVLHIDPLTGRATMLYHQVQ